MDRDFYHDVAMELMSLISVEGLRTKSINKTQFYIFDKANYYCSGLVTVTATAVVFAMSGPNLCSWPLDLARPTFFEDTAEAICRQVR